MFNFITGVAEFLPDLDSVASARAQTLGDKFAAVMVASLTSSKSETRSAAESLLKACIEHDKLSLKSVKKGMKNLLPAQQRTVIPIVARLPHPQTESPDGGKENNVPREPPIETRLRIPHGVSTGGITVSSPRPCRRPETPRRKEERAKTNDSFDTESSQPDDFHPLIANGEPGKKPLSSSRRINWPEHPEEPSSAGQLNSLKKTWSRSLPSRSIAALFPAGGIRKQEDAMSGCALLCKAIEKDRTGKEEAIVDHIDVIFMWTSFALCSRESTVGLQAVITLLMALFAFLQDHQYKLSDSEASILLPHVFEKASIARVRSRANSAIYCSGSNRLTSLKFPCRCQGRFREQFNNIISFFRSDFLLSTRTLGQVICVPLIEHSHQSKTRVLAFHECCACVDRIGLSGLGKKGLLVTAKTLSEENLPENRAAALDLMETVLAKMDGDVEKLASICGTEYLSDKGRVMVEERWKKHAGSQQSMSHQHSRRGDRSRRRSQIPSVRTVADTGRNIRLTASDMPQANASLSPESAKVERTCTEGLRDELPSFKLKLDDITSRHIECSEPITTGPFAFSFDAKYSSHRESEVVDIKDEFISQAKISNMTTGTSTEMRGSYSVLPSNVEAASAPQSEGAAASLRARLLKIREKQKENYVTPAPVASMMSTFQPSLSPSDLSSPLTEPSSATIAKVEGSSTEKGGGVSDNSYETLHASIEELLHMKPPVPEAHPCLRECTSALKKYHASISNQPSAAPDMNYTEFTDFRQSITDKTVETIENLTR